MYTKHKGPSGRTLLAALSALFLVFGAQAETPSYPRMAPVEQYQMARDAEIEMARTAAPESISRDAEILVLGRNGYEVGSKGTNGFVCLVERSFAAALDAPEFWNSKIRGPICLNPAAVRSYLPYSRKKAEWALAGLTTEQMAERIKAAMANNEYPAFEPGAMSYMMSKHQYLSDNGGPGGHWHPHLMWFVAGTDEARWGANFQGSPVLAATDTAERYTIFMVVVDKWSDGTPGPAMK